MTVRRSKFVGQSWAGIGDYRGIGNTYSDNDHSGIDSGAVGVSLNHLLHLGRGWRLLICADYASSEPARSPPVEDGLRRSARPLVKSR